MKKKYMLAILAVISVCIVVVAYFNINKPLINNQPDTNQATTYIVKVAGSDDWNWDELYLQEGIARVKKGDLYGFVDDQEKQFVNLSTGMQVFFLTDLLQYLLII